MQAVGGDRNASTAAAEHASTAQRCRLAGRVGKQGKRTCREVGILRGLNLRGLRSILRYSESAAMRGGGSTGGTCSTSMQGEHPPLGVPYALRITPLAC